MRKFFDLVSMFSGYTLKLSILLLVVLLGTVSVFAQSRKFNGQVTDSRSSPLQGVNVTIKGTNTVVTTDKEGKFEVDGVPGTILVFSFSGMHNKEVLLIADTSLNVSLEENPAALENVVIVGYGTQRKVNLSGAVAQVSGKELINRPVSNVTAALQG